MIARDVSKYEYNGQVFKKNIWIISQFSNV